MTALVWRGKCLRMRPGKGSFPGVVCSQEAKPAPSGAAARTGDPNRLKPLQQAVVRPIQELEAESQNGNPGLITVTGVTYCELRLTRRCSDEHRGSVI